MKISDAFALVAAELTRATEIHGPFRSAHEGWAVIYEEFNRELFAEIMKLRNFDDSTRGLTKEAVQCAAMMMRFLVDLCEVD